jgi:hypothetical protein
MITMNDSPRETADSIRKAEETKGRSYPAGLVEPKWLAGEIVQHCKMQGWKSTLHDVSNGRVWLLQTRDSIAVLVEAADRELVVKAMDQRPVQLKACLTLNGLLALTGAVVAAAALTGAAAWRSQARNAKIDSILRFVDERMRPRLLAAKALPSAPSVADRIRDLASLRDQGLITSEEYETKRKELLKAI